MQQQAFGSNDLLRYFEIDDPTKQSMCFLSEPDGQSLR
jgi:hypothetical protein